MTSPERTWAAREVRCALPAALVAVLGIALSVLAAAGLRDVERRGLTRALDQQGAVARTAVAAELRRYTDTARHVAGALGALPKLDAAGFSAVTAALPRENLPTGTGLSVTLPSAPPPVTVSSVAVGPSAELSAGPPAELTVVAPIRRGTRVVGRVHLGLRGTDLLRTTLRGAPPVGIALDVTGADGHPIHVASTGAADVPSGTTVERTTDFVLGGRTWSLRVRATTGAAGLLGVDAHLDETALIVGAGVSVLLAILVQLLAGGRARATARAAAATADLHRAERSARQQAALFQAVLDGIEEGVAVADEDGAVALLNPSARATLAIPSGGAFRSDGSTPYPSEELPLRRAMSGTACTDELVIRTAVNPEGVRVTVSAQPVDVGSGRRGALAVSRDVTALRACEADLRGMTAALADLGHTRSARERTQRTIDGLLAYAAVRDTPLRSVDVDLTDLVSGVLPVVLRPDGKRPSAHVVVRRLPVVRGDAELLRQLFTRLLSNAVKYTPPDEAPRIAIRAHPVPGNDGWAEVEIADHGIGIPAGQHGALFSGFGGTRPGSGTGLVICHRIVERHGGMIGAADNPGGGTLVRFTLPAAAVPKVTHPRVSLARPLFTSPHDGVVPGMVEIGWPVAEF